jgi:hypothetical protein
MKCFEQKRRDSLIWKVKSSIEREMKYMSHGDLIVLDHVAVRLGNCARIIANLNDRDIKI